MSPLPSSGSWHCFGKQEACHWPALVLEMGGLGSVSLPSGGVSQVAGGLPDQRQLSHPCASPISGWNQDSSANLGRKKVTQHKHKSAGRAQADFTFPLVFPSRWESLETLSWLPGVMHGSEFSSFTTTVLNFSSLSVVFSVVHNLLPHLAPQHCHPCVLLRLGSPCASASGQWMWQTQVLAAGVRCPWRGGLSAGAAIVTACCFPVRGISACPCLQPLSGILS